MRWMVLNDLPSFVDQEWYIQLIIFGSFLLTNESLHHEYNNPHLHPA